MTHEPVTPGAALGAHRLATGRPAVLVAHAGGMVHIYDGPLLKSGRVARGWQPVCGGRHRRLELVRSSYGKTLCARCDRLAVDRIVAGLRRVKTHTELDAWVLVVAESGQPLRLVPRSRTGTLTLVGLVATARAKLKALDAARNPSVPPRRRFGALR